MHVDFKQIPKMNATQIGKKKKKMKLKFMKAKEQNPETNHS